jgi:hydrogenase maturation protease
MTPAPDRRILVAGIGNVFRTDDGFGSEVARRLLAMPWPDGVRVVDYGIRGLHLTYDLLDGWDALVLVDALPEDGGVGGLVLLDIGTQTPRGSASVDAHAMDPATVLATLASLGGRLPPRALLVGCPVADTGDGMGLTPDVDAAVDEAVRAVHDLVADLLLEAEVA